MNEYTITIVITAESEDEAHEWLSQTVFPSDAQRMRIDETWNGTEED